MKRIRLKGTWRNGLMKYGVGKYLIEGKDLKGKICVEN